MTAAYDEGPITWSGEERRRYMNMSDGEWRQLILSKLEEQDKILMQIKDAISIYRAARLGLIAFRWLAGLGAAVAAIWAFVHDGFRLHP